MHGDLKALALQTHPALQDDEKSNDLRKKLEARKALSAATTQVHHGAFGMPFVHCPCSPDRNAIRDHPPYSEEGVRVAQGEDNVCILL